LEDELTNVPVLIYANKQDQENPMSSNELIERLGLLVHKSNKWLVQPTCARNGEGLYEGLDWLANQINNKK
jgi:signal recognition particle receptor subunit beta